MPRNKSKPSMLWRVSYSVGYEIGFALAAIAILVNYLMFPFPRY